MNVHDACEEAYKNGWNDAKSGGKKLKVIARGSIPKRAHKDDAGLDLCAMEDGWIFPKSRKVFETGCSVSIPKNHVGFLTSKSGLMTMGVTSRGTIDSGYTGMIKAVLYNHSWKFVRIRKGQKITQLVLVPIITPEIDLVDALEETERSSSGFGSTGRF